jgi:hypothetical protein
MSSEGWCYQCKYQGVEKVCSGCYAWSAFDRKQEGEPKKTEPNDDWWRCNQEDSSPSIGGYYSSRTGHAGYRYT